MKYDQKHLTLSDSIVIEQGLNAGQTFNEIAISIGKGPSTVSKEGRFR